ncbi:MAG: hypothetical protein ABIW76_08190 [Fibrobacteria bacterium]
MKYILLFLFLISSRSVQGQYVLGKKGGFWSPTSPDSVCLNKGRDSLSVVFKMERQTIPIDSVKYLTFREHKSWWPYLLTAGIVGTSAYTLLHFTGRNDAMYTAEGKARFAGILTGGLTLLYGATLKEVIETHFLIGSKLGPDEVGAIISCSF